MAWPGGFGWVSALESRRLISGMVSGMRPGRQVGWRLARPGRAWVSVRFLSIAAVTAQIASAAMTSMMCRGIAVQSQAWHWSRPKQPFPNSKLSSVV